MPKSKRVEELEGVAEDNYTEATGEYTTKAEMQAALNRIADACVEAMPELDEDDETSEADDSETEDE
jgi:hypothetical protein